MVTCATCKSAFSVNAVQVAGAELPDGGFESDRVLRPEEVTGPIYCGQDCLPGSLAQMTKKDSASK